MPKIRKKPSISLLVKQRGQPGIRPAEFDPEKHLNRREKKLWRGLPDKSKRLYIEKAQREYYKKLLGKYKAKTAVRGRAIHGAVVKRAASMADREGGHGSLDQMPANKDSQNPPGQRPKAQYVPRKPETSQSRVPLGLPGPVTQGKGLPVNKALLVANPAQAAGEIALAAVRMATREMRQAAAQDGQKKQAAVKEYAARTSSAAQSAGRLSGREGEPKKHKALLPALLAALALLCIVASSLQSVVGVASLQSSNGGRRLVQAALTEEQAGPHTGGEKYWKWYGFSSRQEWCACFVSWCADQCGYIDGGLFPKSASVANYRQWYQERGLYQEKGGYTPKAGDLLIFENDSHIGIVQYVEDNRVMTVEGNTSDEVHAMQYPLDWQGISGYCTPLYPSESDFTGNTNAEITWNFLKSKECSDAAAAGIMGNLQQESGIDPLSRQNGGPGRGIAQWEVGSNRFGNLVAKAAGMGKEWTDIEPQLEYLWDEFSGGEATCKYILDRDYGGLSNFMKTTDVHWAARAFEQSFERAGIPAMEMRYQYADSFYAQYAAAIK